MVHDGAEVADSVEGRDQGPRRELAGRSARKITETGVPGGAISDRAAHASTLISIFCIPPTFNAGGDLGFDWPGRGLAPGNGPAPTLKAIEGTCARFVHELGSRPHAWSALAS